MLEQAFKALKTYDTGDDPKKLAAIHDEIVKSHGNASERAALEEGLLGALKGGLTRRGVDFVCRKLMIIGTKASVSALAAMLDQKDHSHMARYALERIDAPEAAEAMRAALGKVSNDLKVGMMSSLGGRQDEASVPAIAALLGDGDEAVATAAAHALGAIRSPAAAKALADAKPCAAADDASLACAESLLSDGKREAAAGIYRRLVSGKRPKHVRLAATRGMLAARK